MKVSEIEEGGIYHDGKCAVRKVLLIYPGSECNQVRYLILAAKVEQEYSFTESKMVPLIGTTSVCSLASFASWAKSKHAELGCEELLARLAARKIKLSPGEMMFMKSALDEAEVQITQGTLITYDHTEGRAVRGLEAKGLVVRKNGEVEVSDLGAAWFHNALDASRRQPEKKIEHMDIIDALAREKSWRSNPSIRVHPATARVVASVLADRVCELEQQVAILRGLVVGARVLVLRGNGDRGPETGPGFGRKIPAVVEAVPAGFRQVQCRLMVDDPDAVGSPNRAGESGLWAVSQISHE